MAPDNFQAYLAQELGLINNALADALEELPRPCQPMARHVFSAGGKRLRPFLTLLFSRMLGCGSQDVYRLSASMELLHAATLLHDDILDNATSRRGQPAAHIIFGIPATLLAGDAMLALGNAITAAFGNPALTACYSAATMQTAAGEILEMNSLCRPELARDEYMEIARGKTACLISQACELGARFAGAPENIVKICSEFGENLGLAFQLVDDALDFAPEAQTGKPGGGDLREGKMTLPINLYRANLSETDRAGFDAAFRTAGFSRKEYAELYEAIAPFASQSLVFADTCLARAGEALARLPDSPERKVLLEMAAYVRNRKK